MDESTTTDGGGQDRGSARSAGSRNAGRDAKMKTVLFACVHNAGRSQIAAAFFNALADPAKARASSAGTQPIERVHPEVIEVMREVGMELAHATPQLLTDEIVNEADVLVTMG